MSCCVCTSGILHRTHRKRRPSTDGYAPPARGSDDPPSSFFPLRCVPNGTQRIPLASYAIENDMRGAPNDQLANAGFSLGSPEMRMVLQSFNHCHNARGQSFRSIGLVLGRVSANFKQPRSCHRRADDLYRHSASSSCSLPQMHFGGGNSRSVPQERSQAFISSSLM